MWATPGVFSLVLVYPAIFWGARLAESSPVENTPRRRFTSALVLTLFGILAGISIHLAPVPLIGVFFYTVLSCVHIVRFGRGPKRIGIAIALFAWMFLCFAVYVYAADQMLRVG
ncbi:MAG TPA: hypothetical protein VOA78_10515 [Candidatus Dormibacteraeota bacterium]|nr:hypothetical protein [Candidatus Dormibacteraeota bacterium]